MTVYFLFALSLLYVYAEKTLDTAHVHKLAEQYALEAAARYPNAGNLQRSTHILERLIQQNPDVFMAAAKDAFGGDNKDKASSLEAQAAAHALLQDKNTPIHIVSSSAHKNAAAAAKPSSNSKRSLDSDALAAGGNGNYRHCETSREVAQLSVDAFPDLSLLHPFVQLKLDEAHAKLRFEVELPYIAFDARYLISFEPIEHAHATPLPCSSSMPDLSLAAYDELWGHAPNANYHDAFSSRQKYGAYYSPPGGKWSVSASGCSHVVYSGEFSVDDLLQCRDAAESFSFGTSAVGDKHRLAVLSGALHVSVLKPKSAAEQA